jgi:hypothetical protein
MNRYPGTESRIFYGAWIDDALRGLVKRALTLATEQGLPGKHHFYITFRTGHPGVVIPSAQRAQYPNEMTIVLQHQFDSLTVSDDSFEVALSFGGVRTPMRIPFSAMTGFADPSVNFALQFNHAAAELAQAGEATDGRQGIPTNALAADDPAAPRTDGEKPGAEGEKPGPDGEKVVALDSFRKKS